MNKSNKITILFKYAEKQYEFKHFINLKNFVIDDMFHKVLYYQYYIDNISLKQDNLAVVNKYQILTNLNELYMDLKENQMNIEEKIKIKRKNYMILEPKGKKLNIFISPLIGNIENINTYDLFSIKEVKIMHDLLNTNSNSLYHAKLCL